MSFEIFSQKAREKVRPAQLPRVRTTMVLLFLNCCSKFSSWSVCTCALHKQASYTFVTHSLSLLSLFYLAMSRYLTHGGNAVAANILNNIAAKESNYKENIKLNHTMAKNAAKRIRELEQMLPGMIDGIMSSEELSTFLREQKDAVKKIAEENVERERNVDAFVSAVRTVQQQVVQSPSSSSSGNDETNDEAVVDYQKAIDQAMQQHRSVMNIHIHQEAMYRDVAAALGEPVAAPKKKNGKNDDDDDIEVVQTESQGATLKCPITGAFMEDAVRNKVCQHVYSRAGITAHIQKRCECPMVGCGNKQVTMSQLEDDVETVMNVRREKRRQDRQTQLQASQASDLMDSDEDEGQFH
jgi:Zinc-finger of the MIZ type in Nse subunit